VYWIPLRYVDQIGMSGAWAVVLASVLPLSILLPMCLHGRRQIRRDLGTIIVIGAFTGMGLSFYAIGLVYTSVIRATLLYYLTPIWSTLFGMAFLGEPVGKVRWIAITIGLVGLFFILGGASVLATPLNIGDAFGLASGVSWGIGALYLKKNPDIPVTGPVASMHFFSFLAALVCCLVLPRIEGIPSIGVWLSASPVMWLYTCLVLLPSLFAIFWAARKLYPGRVGILMMTEVLVAVASASILLAEMLALLEWFGVILILAAGLIEVIGGKD
jgi:drug/metabolite transporter (DMT)-like permease